MAKLFKGMSVDNFLDGLVERAGLNGHELYDYLLELVEKNGPKEQKTVEIPKPTPTKECELDITLDEMKELYLLHGGNPNVSRYFGCSAPELVMCHVAGVMGVKKMTWIRPVTLYWPGKPSREGKAKYVIEWDNEEENYIWHTKEILRET